MADTAPEIAFPSPQVGSGHASQRSTKRIRHSFHPLKSGRDSDAWKPSPERCMVSIPSSRVGTLHALLWAIYIAEFPSPQVGSGRGAAEMKRRRLVVSIPSSRVGTRLSLLWSGFCWRVSIPSSRVGTVNSSLAILRLRMFPSPQVGSGQVVMVRDLEEARRVSIPSSRVGTAALRPCPCATLVSIPSSRVGTPSWTRKPLRLWGVSIPSSRVGTVWVDDEVSRLDVSIPSSRVGTSSPRAAARPSWCGFHPLKSGRDHLPRGRKRSVPQVSIPSSRVGTGHRLSPPTMAL